MDMWCCISKHWQDTEWTYYEFTLGLLHRNCDYICINMTCDIIVMLVMFCKIGYVRVLRAIDAYFSLLPRIVWFIHQQIHIFAFWCCSCIRLIAFWLLDFRIIPPLIHECIYCKKCLMWDLLAFGDDCSLYSNIEFMSWVR